MGSSESNLKTTLKVKYAKS